MIVARWNGGITLFTGRIKFSKLTLLQTSTGGAKTHELSLKDPFTQGFEQQSARNSSMWQWKLVNKSPQHLRHESSCLKYLSLYQASKNLTWISKLLCNFTRGAHSVISICHWIIYVGTHKKKNAVPRICQGLLSTTTQEKGGKNSAARSIFFFWGHLFLEKKKLTESEERR